MTTGILIAKFVYAADSRHCCDVLEHIFGGKRFGDCSAQEGIYYAHY